LRRTVLIFFDCFSNGHISGALAELIRSTRAPTKEPVSARIGNVRNNDSSLIEPVTAS
jgi:hypothetical protein